MAAPNPPTPPSEVYAVSAGAIDQMVVQKFFNSITIAINAGVKTANVLFHTTRGVIFDGICLYNFFKSVPIDLCFYNVGAVSSIGCIAYLCAKHRYVSATANFMIHQAQGAAQSASAARLYGIAQSVAMDNERIETILRESITLPPKLWKTHKMTDLWLTAKQAVDFKLATEIREFAPPAGATIFNVLG
jgi:ATP-dependent protease ClpP protease subunit